MKKILSWVVVVFTLGTQAVCSQSSPVPMLESSAHQIIEVLKENKSKLKTNRQIVYHAVEQHLLPHVDVQGMSRSVLGRQVWNKASAQQKNQFSAAFTRLVIRTYSTPLAGYSDETIRFYPARASAGRFTRVNSVIVRSNGHHIPLTYSLVSVNGSWKIYDLSVEGVSLLQSFRTQFSDALQGSSIQAVIKQMNQKSHKAA